MEFAISYVRTAEIEQIAKGEELYGGAKVQEIMDLGNTIILKFEGSVGQYMTAIDKSAYDQDVIAIMPVW